METQDRRLPHKTKQSEAAETQPEPVSEAILQNLKDAGCDGETIEDYIDCCGSGKDQVRLLKKHRRCLLDKLHEGQKQIDCLDYLIYQVEKDLCKKEEESDERDHRHD